MNFEKLVNNRLLVFFFFFVLVLSLKFNTLNMPYVRDAFGMYVSPSITVKDNSFNPFYGNDKLAPHPPLFFEVLALTFAIFGVHLWVAHSLILLSAIISLYYTYLIGSYLYKPSAGFIAALLLLFSPLFFAQIGMVMLDVFLIPIAAATVYYALQKKLVNYLILGNLLVLTKEPGIIIILAITLYHFLFEKKKIKDLMVYSSPIFTFILWAVINKLVYGWFFFPDYVGLFGFEIFLKEVLLRINQVFITNYHLILTLFILFFIIRLEKKLRITTFLGMLVSIFVYSFCRYIANFLSLIQKIISINLVDVLKVNLHDLYSIRYIAPLIVLLIFLIPDIIKHRGTLSKKLKKEVWLLLFCIFSIISFFSFISGGYQQRYMLMIYPLFFVIGSKALVTLFKHRKVYIFVMIAIIALFITQWRGNFYPVCGPCEENLEYIQVIKTHQDMARFIETNYPNSVVLTECPQTEELTYLWGGYVNKKIKVLEIEKQEILRRGANNYSIPELNEFDLVYYSLGGVDSKELEETVRLYNLTLIKKIERNGKIAFLYGKNENKA